jgi:hypothetical protein
MKGLNPEGLGAIFEALCGRAKRKDISRHLLKQRDKQEQHVRQVRTYKQHG